MPIIWRPQMSVGNDFVDNDHRYLLCLVNTIELALKNGGEEGDLRLALDQLVDYTHEHFAREERLQIRVGYPDYAQHKMQHQELLENVERARRAVLDRSRESAMQSAAAEAPATARADAGEGEVSMAELEALMSGDSPDLEMVAGVEHGMTDQELVALMRRWILEHVLQTDMKLKAYFVKHPSNLMG